MEMVIKSVLITECGGLKIRKKTDLIPAIKVTVLAALYVLAAATIVFAEEKPAGSWLRINGSEVVMTRSTSELKPGDLIGAEMYRAKQEGLEYDAKQEARQLARIFAEPDEIFDCVLIKEKQGLRLVTAKNESGVTAVGEMIIPAAKPGQKRRSDNVEMFPGSSWDMSLEAGYENGEKNFCNLYRTKRTDIMAIKAHYKKALEKGKWKLLSEWDEDNVYFIMAMRNEESIMITVTRNNDGSYVINITG